MSEVLSVAALVGVLAAIFQLWQIDKQRRRDFEDLFVQRYWAIMDRLSLEAAECRPTKPDEVSREDRLAVIAYLRLCEDELDLRAERWISADTWGLWRAGIATQLRRWPFDVVWKDVRERESKAGATGQFVQLRRACDDMARFDPPRSTAARRLGRGR